MLMQVKNGVTNYYIYGPGLLYQITETASGTNTLTYHFDFRGSTIALSADSGLVTDRIEYSAYGLTTYRIGTSDTPFLFNGRFGVQTDPNGLLYMRARYYNPYLCRFVSADPAGFAGGLNHYAYANGNPVSLLDPFGLNAFATGDTSFNSFGTSQNSLPNIGITLPGEVNSSSPVNDIPQMSQNNNPSPQLSQNDNSVLQNQTFNDMMGNGSQLTADQAAVVAAPIAAFLPLPGLQAADEAVATTRFVSTENGIVDVQPTLDRIESGGSFPHRNDGSIFQNREGLLPTQPSGYYNEYVVPTPGVTGPGPMRIVTGQKGQFYFTPNHYQTFVPLNPH